MKVYKQHDLMDCGPACLRMIAKYYGKNISLTAIREKSYLTKEGVSLIGLSNAAENFGLKSLGSKLSVQDLYKKAPLPCILHFNENHFVVLYKVKKTCSILQTQAKENMSYPLNNFLKNGYLI